MPVSDGDIRALERMFLRSLRAASMRSWRAAARDVLAALRDRDADRAMEALVRAGYERTLASGVTQALARAYRVGGLRAAMDVRQGLAVESRAATEYARQHAAELVTRITDDLRAEIRTHITTGLAEGLSADTIRDRLAGIVPMLPRQSAKLAKLIESGATRSEVQDYISAAKHARALMIARTETVSALNRAYKQRIEKHVERIEWRTAQDEIVCEICEPLDRERVRPGELFGGEFDAPPAHPNCRCTIVAVVDR